MSRHIIIHLPTVGQDHVQWATASDRGLLVSDIESGTLSDAAAAVEGRRASLVLPGDDVLLAEAVVPGGSHSRALQAVPYALEDQVADDVETLHFALGTKGQDDAYPVAIIGRNTMDTVTELCSEAGLRPTEIIPEPLALPKFGEKGSDDAHWTALVDDEQTVVRLNGFKGFATDVGMAGLMLEGARKDLADDTSASIVVYRTQADSSLPLPDDIDVEMRDCPSRISLYAEGLAKAPHINLLQGDYSPKTKFDKAWKPWVWTGVLAVVLGGVLFGSRGLDYWQVTQQEAAIDSEITRVFKDVFPDSRLQRPRAQMKNYLDKLGTGNNDGFTLRLEQLSAALASQPQTALKSISYRNGRFDLDLTTDELPTLDKLQTELSKLGNLKMSVQSANSEKDGLRGRVRVE